MQQLRQEQARLQALGQRADSEQVDAELARLTRGRLRVRQRSAARRRGRRGGQGGQDPRSDASQASRSIRNTFTKVFSQLFISGVEIGECLSPGPPPPRLAFYGRTERRLPAPHVQALMKGGAGSLRLGP